MLQRLEGAVWVTTKNTPLSDFFQATWLQRRQLTDERASSCRQCLAGWWGCPVAGAGEGMAMLHRAVLSPLVSGAEGQGPGEMQTGSIPGASSPRLWWCALSGNLGSAAGSQYEKMWRDRLSLQMWLTKNIWRRNSHYPKTNWSAEIWETLFACQMNKSKAGVFFNKFVFNKNLCSDEISTPTCCHVIVSMATLKAYIFCQMHAI